MSHFVIGLTGGIGCGKTTVSNIFHQLGITIIDADVIAREVVEPNTPALAAIIKHFGSNYLLPSGELNRALLRTKVFSDDAARIWLNELMHPMIRETITTQLQQANGPYAILVAPLLFENKLNTLTNRVLVIDISNESQLNRTLNRDNSSAEEIKRIIAKQISREDRLKAADDVLDNTSDNLEHLRLRITELHNGYKKLAYRKKT